MPPIDREGLKFNFVFDLHGHEVSAWCVNDSPRYCAQIDKSFGMRCSNVKGLFVLLDMATRDRPEPWTGEEVWDDEPAGA